jgi:RimJ/RimL family protein N-acetyltransferase
MKEVFKLRDEDIVLRDCISTDANDYFRWLTEETEWQNWDAPWEKTVEVQELSQFKKKFLKKLEKELPIPRTSLEISLVNGKHLGWVSSYFINNDQTLLSVGINIPEQDYWEKGIGKRALKLWISYLFHSYEIDNLYTQTWSGNLRMINLAEKIGFKEMKRKKKYRKVRNKLYDGLTFILNQDDFSYTF